MAISQTQLEQLYLAYFGRPADFDGLVFYTSNPNFDIWSVAAAFSASPESQALYGSGTDPHQISASTINAIYQNLFNRDAEPAGLLYWSTEVASGRLTAAGAAYGILLGAQNEDLIAVNNKMTVSAAFTAALNTAPEIIGYSGDAAAAAARAFLATVDSTAGSVTTAMAGLDAAVAAVVAIGGPAGETFTLTTGLDNVVGTAGNDTIVGTIDQDGLVPLGTLNVLDSIDGGAGNDTFEVYDVSVDGVPDGLIVKNVETLVLRSSDDAYADTTTWQGLNTIKVTQAWDADIYAGATTNVEVTGADDDIYVEGGANVTVVSSNESGSAYIELVGAAGAVSVTQTELGDNSIDIDGGTDVTVVATGAGQFWWSWWSNDISIGDGGDPEDLPTGAISVTVTGVASEAGDDLYLTDIYVNGGTTVDVQQTATSSSAEAAADTAGATVYQGYVQVNGGASTTEVTVMQSAAVAEVAAIVATAGVKQVDTVTFVSLLAGESVTVGGLTFTAAKALTAAQVAAAFANLTAAATQGSAPASNGIYSGTFGAYTTGAVTTTGTVITVDATASAAATGSTPIVVADTIVAAVDLGTANKTPGVTAVAAKTGVLGIVGGSVDVDDVGTEADTIATVTLHGYGIGSTVASDALATLDLGHSNENLTVFNASTGATLALTLNAVGTADDHASVDASGAYTTINVGTYGANSVVDLTATAATTLNVGGDKALDLTGSTLAALTTVSVTGSASLTMDIDESDTITSFNASGTSGAVTAFVDASKSTYAGGSGVDTLTLTSATVSKAVSMGAGDDVLKLATGTPVLTATLSGGDGSDALFMLAADAEVASAGLTFETQIDSFEKLSLGVVGAGLTETINLANMDDISFVVVNNIEAAGVLVLDKMASGGTLVFQNKGSLGTVDVNLTDATGTADSLNVIVKADATLAAGTVDAAGVEAINLTVNDSKTKFDAVHTVNLVDAALTTVTVTGNAGLTLTQDSTVLTSVDGSAMTGALTAGTNGTVAQTITGGAGADVLTANGNGDTLIGGAGADTLIAKGDLDVLTGGAGSDVFNVSDATTNLNSYATITDLFAGDTILFTAGAADFAASKVTLGDTAVFQDYANFVINSTDTGDVSWFQFSGNTYVIENVSNGASFLNGNDVVVKIVGAVDLSTASFSSSADTLLIV